MPVAGFLNEISANIILPNMEPTGTVTGSASFRIGTI